MKTIRNISVLLLVVAPGLCFAEMLLDERAKPRTRTWPGGKALDDTEKANSYQ